METHLVRGGVPCVDQCVMNLGPSTCIPAELTCRVEIELSCLALGRSFMRMGLAHVTPRRSIGLSWNVLSLATNPANSGGKFARNRASPGYIFLFLLSVYGYRSESMVSDLHGFVSNKKACRARSRYTCLLLLNLLERHSAVAWLLVV